MSHIRRLLTIFGTDAVGGGARAFSPLSLSPSGFWIPEPAFLFEEEDGTGTVTATEAVGYWEDQGSGGTPLLQATASARPTYQTSGGLHWLESATSDFMSASRNLNQPFDRVSAWRFLGADGSAQALLGGVNPTNGPTLYRSAGELRIYAGTELTGLTVPANDVDFVAVERFNGASSRLRIDKGSYQTGNAGAENATELVLFAGMGGTAQFVVARCYGIFERPGGDLSDSAIDQLCTYFAARYGGVL